MWLNPRCVKLSDCTYSLACLATSWLCARAIAFCASSADVASRVEMLSGNTVSEKEIVFASKYRSLGLPFSSYNESSTILPSSFAIASIGKWSPSEAIAGIL